MLAYQLNNSVSTGNSCNKYTIANQQDIRRKLSFLFGKKVPLSIKVPEKLASDPHLTTITSIEDNHIFLDGFPDSEDLLLQNTLDVSADFEGIAVNFRLSELSGYDVDAAFNVKALLPQSMEWVQRRDARRVKVPIRLPVKIQHKNQTECFDLVDISVDGLSYIDQSEGHDSATSGEWHKDSNLILPDNSLCLVSFEIVNNIAVPCKHSNPINRVGCQIKGGSYRLDAALQRLINQIDLYSKRVLA